MLATASAGHGPWPLRRHPYLSKPAPIAHDGGVTERKAQNDSFPAGPVEFQTTHWSIVLAAAETDAETSSQALSELYRTYWRPLYVFLRRGGARQPTPRT